MPGVAARDRQNYAQDLQLSIRGFGARSTFGVRGVRIYVDGIPATMPDGQGQLSHIDLASAGRVELLRGPFSVLYGNSSGGVLQVFTEAGEGAPVVSSSLAVGSGGLARPGVRVSASTPTLGYAISANRFSSDGWREHSSAERNVGNARLDVETRGGQPLDSGGQHHQVARGRCTRPDARAQFDAAPRSADASATQFNTRKTVTQSQLGLVHERQLDAGDGLRLMAYTGGRDTDQFQAIPAGPQANALHPGGVIGLERRYAGADLRWTRKRQTALGPLGGGGGPFLRPLERASPGLAELRRAGARREGRLRRDEDNEVSNVDPYLQAVWMFAAALDLDRRRAAAAR